MTSMPRGWRSRRPALWVAAALLGLLPFASPSGVRAAGPGVAVGDIHANITLDQGLDMTCHDGGVNPLTLTITGAMLSGAKMADQDGTVHEIEFGTAVQGSISATGTGIAGMSENINGTYANANCAGAPGDGNAKLEDIEVVGCEIPVGQPICMVDRTANEVDCTWSEGYYTRAANKVDLALGHGRCTTILNGGWASGNFSAAVRGTSTPVNVNNAGQVVSAYVLATLLALY